MENITTTCQTAIYNPNEIVNIFSESLARRNTGLVTVRGIFRSGKNSSYGGFRYCSLKDEHSMYELSLRVPDGLYDELEDGNLAELRGTVDRKVSNYCSVQLQLNVTGVSVIQEQVISEEDLKRAEIRRHKGMTGYRKVDSLLEGIIYADGRPSVALLFAGSSITDADFDAGKEAAAVQIDFREYRVSFAKADAFVRVLREADSAGHDLVCIVRGGGSGLEALENTEVLSAVADMKTAVVTAVGHAADRVFINEIADLEIGTPSLLGSYFKDLVERVAKMKSESTAALTRKIEAQFKEQIETARRQNAELQKKFESLSGNNLEATRKHDEQVKAAQEQNANLQKQLKDLMDASRKRDEEMTTRIGQMQDNMTRLTKENTRLSKELGEASNKNGRLQEQLARDGKGTDKKTVWLTVGLAALSLILTVLLILK